MNSSLFPEEAELYLEMEQDINHTYQLLTSSRYVNNRNLESVCTDAKTRVKKIRKDPLLCFLVYMNGIYTLSLRGKNTHEYERRFIYFFQSITHEIIEVLQTIQTNLYRQFLSKLIALVIKDQQDQYAPWPPLLQKMLYEIRAEHIEYIYVRLSKKIEIASCSRHLVLTYSYVALLSGKEVTSLMLLQKHVSALGEQDVTSHFQILKERGRWRTMKQWFHALFPHKKNNQYGSLQKFVDEMNSALPISQKEQELIWERWLLSPNFQRFQTYSKHLSKQQQLTLVERLLPELEKRLHQTEAAKTYEKLLLMFEKYELAVRYLLKHERDPLRLREEKIELLNAITTYDKKLARPVYHQFIVRLVEKKSRVYYEQAALYLKELHELYESEQDQILFRQYVSKLKKMYRTYRAFVEELKRIDL
ncbi:hypothetical protein [Halalkalibacter okhensis]|uniref:Uncharacterized protein n=1 Tax=Halalkalibacter okhensis TaxID=333138 RepID=A0A0B0I7L9_9BACI|nr:hypothetical protein [Halalkalibacter okhensis]KHF38433.1 hypothetical protein LQ50_21435 [Halalkalibacter okhensis]